MEAYKNDKRNSNFERAVLGRTEEVLTKKKYLFTPLQIKLALRRDILRREVEKVIENPDYIQRDNHKVIVNRKLNKKILEVVLVRENKKTIILTCYFL